MACEVDCLDVDVWDIWQVTVRVQMRVVVSVCKHYRNEAACHGLRERNIHDLFFFEVDKCAKSKTQILKFAWSPIGVLECIRVETLAELN